VTGGVHVRLRLAAECYALPVEAVVETAEARGLAPVPGAPSSVAGVCNLRGELLPVFDLAVVLGLERTGTASRLLVVECDRQRAGLVVDEVHDVCPLTGPAQEAESELLAGAVLDEGALVGVLDVPRLFEQLALDTQ
jgi:chemotaxis signal transduction protein